MLLRNRDAWPRLARSATSPWLLSPLLVVTLAIGSFIGYGAWTRSRPTHYSRGGVAFGPDTLSPSPSSSPAANNGKVAKAGGKPPAGTAKTPAGKASAGPTAARRGGSSPGGSSSGSSSSGSSSSGGSTSGASAATTGPVHPAAGSYTLAADGSEDVKFGPYSACHNTFPARSSLVISAASGEPAGSYDFDQRFFPSSAGKHDERHIYRYTDKGVFLSFEQATVTCAGVKQSTTVNYSPLQLRVPSSVRVGQSWHNSGGDSNRTESGMSQVVDTATVVVAGHPYRTYVIDTHLDMTGSERGSRDQRWWWSPDLGIPLKWHESLSGSRSGATYSEDVTFTVVRTP